MEPLSRAEVALMFVDRRHAGRLLAERLSDLDLHDPVVVGLPRGGVVVAAEVAAGLGAPLDVLVVRKLGCPWHPELGLGAIAEGGVRLVNNDLVLAVGATDRDLEVVAQTERAELDRRVGRYRAGRAPLAVTDRTVVVVDDGLATGFTARAAIAALRARGPARVVLAVPVGARETVHALQRLADLVVCLEVVDDLDGVGRFYRDFSQTSDGEVEAILAT